MQKGDIPVFLMSFFIYIRKTGNKFDVIKEELRLKFKKKTHTHRMILFVEVFAKIKPFGV